MGKYGLMIRPDETGGWDGCRVHQLASDKELREALEKLGCKPDEITYAFGKWCSLKFRIASGDSMA